MMSIPQTGTQQGVGPSLANIELVQNSKLFRAECERLIQETDKTCKRMQDYDNKRLDQRAKDIQFLKKELELKLEEIILEIDGLVVFQSRVQKALEACKDPLEAVVLCLEERMKRAPAERLHDRVDKELLKERDATEDVAVLLKRVSDQVTEQIRLNRSAKYHLEQDLKEKFEAQCIDNTCDLMTTHSISNLNRSTNTKPFVPSMAVTPAQWLKISNINLNKAEHQKNNSMSLRVQVESLLRQTAADMQRQFQTTTTAFQLNIQELKNSKSQMEDQLAKILVELSDQQKIKEDLLVAIGENEHCLNLAQSRLSLRHQRPSKEQCYDPPQSQLYAEVKQITAHINTLRMAVAQSEKTQMALAHCQLELQENIEMKTTSLYIDEVICSQHREPIVIQNF